MKDKADCIGLFSRVETNHVNPHVTECMKLGKLLHIPV